LEYTEETCFVVHHLSIHLGENNIHYSISWFGI